MLKTILEYARSLASPPKTIEPHSSEPSLDEVSALEYHLVEMAQPLECDEDYKPADDTEEILVVMRQEKSHSLERDIHDPFFWKDARPDAVAGLAKVYLAARCPTPYWRSAVSSSQYALWGAVIAARAQARLLGSSPGLATLLEANALGLSELSSILSGLLVNAPLLSREIHFADGLPLPGNFLGDIHGFGAIRILFGAIAAQRNIAWPDLPPRLVDGQDIPERLPALSIDIDTLLATPLDCSAAEAEAFWASAQSSRTILFIPDWSAWLISDKRPPISFSKWPQKI
jgi:hypothetical protein